MNLDKTLCLIDVTAEFNLQMTLPKSLPTLCTMALCDYTKPDNVFMSSSLCTAVVFCNTNTKEWPVRSNHIITIINVDPEIQMETPRADYRAVDWEAIRVELALKLEELDGKKI